VNHWYQVILDFQENRLDLAVLESLEVLENQELQPDQLFRDFQPIL
jgi:hypothetical protein